MTNALQPDTLSLPGAGHAAQRVTIVVAVVSVAVFCLTLPFAKVQLPAISAFIPIYETALIVNDVTTAVLLFGQVVISRSRAVAVLASGYLFTAMIASFHMLTFPGLFSTAGLLGATPQSTAWIYMFWHGGFPLFVIAYAVLGCMRDSGGGGGSEFGRNPVRSVCLAVAAITGLAGGFAFLATAGSDLLPPIMIGSRYTPLMFWVAGATWVSCILALVVLWRVRSHSVIDAWLMVVLCVWICDVALSVVFNGGRYDLGFYVGRLFGLLAASFVLLALLVENSFLYSRLAAAHSALKQLAVTDPLTGVANRRAFDEALNTEWRRAVRAGTPLSLLMIDVDFFKLFNDSYGHVQGDACLRTIGHLFADTVHRPGDKVARYGGEEFAIILPHTDEASAVRLGWRLCDAVKALAIPHGRSPVAAHVTISVGVACLDDLPQPLPKERPGVADLVEAADGALYAAKAQGRGCVRSASEQP